jgi:serine/threonine protein kinase
MVKLNHPCVLRIVNWALADSSMEAEIHTEFASNRSLKEVLEKVNCGEKPPFWTSTGIGILIVSLVLGMRYIHSRGIIHRDLKPSNILINGKEYGWISDFGASRSETEDAASEKGTGTVRYAAPEQFEEGSICSTKCDVFVFGLVLYEILVGKPVFPGSESHLNIIQRIRRGDLPVPPDGHGDVMQTLIGRCWKRDPQYRPSFGQIYEMFEAVDFRILPRADPTGIRDFAKAIVEWESRSATQKPSQRA